MDGLEYSSTLRIDHPLRLVCDTAAVRPQYSDRLDDLLRLTIFAWSPMRSRHNAADEFR